LVILVIISVVSLVAGAGLGPSSAMVVAGGGMRTWLKRTAAESTRGDHRPPTRSTGDRASHRVRGLQITRVIGHSALETNPRHDETGYHTFDAARSREKRNETGSILLRSRPWQAQALRAK